jgi:hypothetical protein
MAGRIRQDRGTPAVEPVVHAPRMVRVSKTIRKMACPCCGMTHGEKRLTKRKPFDLPEVGDTVNFWETVRDFDPDKLLGVIQEVGAGRGRSFTVKGRFGPEDDPDGYYPLVMRRLLAATKEALIHGWITEGAVLAMLGESKTPGRIPRKNGHSITNNQANGHTNGNGYGKIPRK